VLVYAFDSALRLLHPIVPFITESLWQRLPARQPGAFLMRATWPHRAGQHASPAAEQFELVREVVLAIRQIRGDNAVAPGKVIEVLLRPSATAGNDVRALFGQESQMIGRLTRSEVRLIDSPPDGAAAHAVLSGGTEIIVPLAGLIDVEKECTRLRGEVSELAKQITSREGRLNNAKYVEKAPPQVVANDRAILDEMKSKHGQLVDKVRSLCGV
jgi:valyl-tRNA synthetase